MDNIRVNEIIRNFESCRVGVVGDLMLDRYIWGSASRISQEAPVPVIDVQRTSSAPGGSANVLRNLATLGAQPVAFGLVGDDATGQELVDALQALKVHTDRICHSQTRRTTEKTRVLASNQQVVRVDVEEKEAIEAGDTAALLDQLEASVAAGELDAILIADYAKGVVTESLLESVIALGKQYAIPVGLDPHSRHDYNLPGLTVMTPNRPEAFALAGVHYEAGKTDLAEDHALREVVDRLEAQWAPTHLLVTLGAHGMALFEKGETLLHVPTRAREVFDVSGAGDTVITTFILGLLAGASTEEAAELSNHAAGVVVGKVGTAPVYPQELLDSFSRDDSE